MTELETELLAALKGVLRDRRPWLWPEFDAARAAIAKAEGATKAEGRCSLCGKPWPFVVPCMWGGCPMGAD